MTNIEHQPKPNTRDEKSQTVDDILGSKDPKERSLGRATIFRLGEESLVRFSMPKEEADELKEVAAITDASIGYLVRAALKPIIEDLRKARDWRDKEHAYRQRMKPFLPPLSESQKDSASPAELSE